MVEGCGHVVISVPALGSVITEARVPHDSLAERVLTWVAQYEWQSLVPLRESVCQRI
jgi:hypothetical protein